MTLGRAESRNLGILLRPDMDERPGKNRTNLGVWSEVSRPFRCGSALLMTIAYGLSRPDRAGLILPPKAPA